METYDTQDRLSIEEDHKTLNASRASVILVVFLIMALGTGIVAELINPVVAEMQGRNPNDPIQLKEARKSTLPTMITVSTLVSGLGMWVISLAMFPKYIKNPSPLGAAWILGPIRNIFFGLVIGTLIGSVYLLGAAALGAKIYVSLEPAREAISNLPQFCLIASTLVLGPSIEELFFRGILYAGYRRSFGPFAALVLTTLIFCMLHFPKSLSGLIPIFFVALSALWFRLRCGAIGPAIAIHVAYNTFITFVNAHF